MRSLEPSQRAALVRYAELIRLWAPQTNLISARDLERLEERHLEDSLRALPAVLDAPEGPAIDVGSGAGLPGIPLAIATPGRDWTLLEPRSLRARFLEEVIGDLGLRNARVVKARAQAAASDPELGGRFVVATARALAAPGAALELLRPLIAPGGTCLIFVGETGLPPEEATEVAPGIVRVILDGGG